MLHTVELNGTFVTALRANRLHSFAIAATAELLYAVGKVGNRP